MPDDVPPLPLHYARPALLDTGAGKRWGAASMGIAVGTPILLMAAWWTEWTAVAFLLVPCNPIAGLVFGVIGFRRAKGGDAGGSGAGLILNGLLLVPGLAVGVMLAADRVLG